MIEWLIDMFDFEGWGIDFFFVILCMRRWIIVGCVDYLIWCKF